MAKKPEISRHRKDYLMARAAGFCGCCRSRKASRGHATCNTCRERMREAARKMREAAGVTPRAKTR